MNRFLRIAFLISAVLVGRPHARAQFPVFPDSNAVWRTDQYDGPNFLWSSHYHMEQADHDSLINGDWYSLIWYGLEGQSFGLVGGLREDADQRVYFYHANTDSTYLLYDFDPAVGDSMEVWTDDPLSSSPITQWMFIESVDQYANDNGTIYKEIGIMNRVAILGQQGVSNWWIQGVGGTGGLFTTSGSLSVSGSSSLGCMLANDTLWPQGIPGACWPTGIVEQDQGSVSPWFHPTVTSGVLYLDVATDQWSIGVFSMDGRLVSRPLPLGTAISTSALPSGAYVLCAVDALGHVRRGRFLKE